MVASALLAAVHIQGQWLSSNAMVAASKLDSDASLHELSTLVICRALDPWLSEQVKRKVSVCGSDPAAIRKASLLSHSGLC